MSPAEKLLFDRIAATRRIPPARLAGEILRKWMAEWGRGDASIPERIEELGPLTDLPTTLREIEERIEGSRKARQPTPNLSSGSVPRTPVGPAEPALNRKPS